jgi:hypothetical protein
VKKKINKVIVYKYFFGMIIIILGKGIKKHFKLYAKINKNALRGFIS